MSLKEVVSELGRGVLSWGLPPTLAFLGQSAGGIVGFGGSCKGTGNPREPLCSFHLPLETYKVENILKSALSKTPLPRQPARVGYSLSWAGTQPAQKPVWPAAGVEGNPAGQGRPTCGNGYSNQVIDQCQHQVEAYPPDGPLGEVDASRHVKQVVL